MRHHDKILNQLVRARILAGTPANRQHRLVRRDFQRQRFIQHTIRSIKVFFTRSKSVPRIRMPSGLISLIGQSRKAKLSAEDWLSYVVDSNNPNLLSFILSSSELVSCLRAGIKERDLMLFDNKLDFHKACIKEGIPSPEVIAWTINQEEYHSNRTPIRAKEKTSLFAKPINGICGKGAVRISDQGNGELRWGKEPELYKWKDLRELTLNHAKKCNDDILIQPCLRNHPDIERLTGRSLATIRIVTCRRQEKPSIILSTLRCPNRASYVDNFAQGGLAAPICVETGQITGPACQKRLTSGIQWHNLHTESQIPFQDFAIPHWRDVQQLVLNAHMHWFDRLPSAGWDIAVLANGPSLIEVNPIWCADVVQISNQKGLLDTLFKDHILEEWAIDE
jgi:hypothetical protein